jgi:hypothetical protein
MKERRKEMIIKLGPKTISIPAARWPHIQLPFFKLLTAIRIPIPKAIMNLGGSTRAIALSLLLVAGGFGASFALVIHSTSDVPAWPEAGAQYALPDTNGVRLAPDEETPMERSQTLKINLASGVRLTSLSLTNLSLGKAGLTDCIEITRAQGNSSGWLYVDNWTATGVSAPSADFANMEVGTLSLAAYVDGHTVESTLDSTITDLEISSNRGSGSFTAQDSVVDRVIVALAGDAVVGTLAMTNVHCSVGGWNVDHVKTGHFTLDATSKFGDGDGIDLADFVVNSTVKTRVMTDNLVDTPISVK